MPPKAKTPEELFWRNVEKTNNDDECWIWKGSRNSNGYGVIVVSFGRTKPKQFRAHRVSYQLHYGDLQPEDKVLHSCDNPRCVNPKHLRKGTQQDNLADMVAKGRNRYKTHYGGMGHGSAKLTPDLVRYIRQTYATGQYTQQSIADQVGISPSVVGSVVTRKTWRHIE